MAKKKRAKQTTITRTFTDGDTTVKLTVKDKNNITASRKTTGKRKTAKKRPRRRDGGDSIAFLYN